MSDEPMPFHLVEKTPGPWHGHVLRTEVMTPSEAEQRNSKMSGVVILWERANESKEKKGKK